MSFWGATVTSSKAFEESVPTNANLVVSHVSLAGLTDGVTTLMCTVEGTDGDFVVAHLSWGRNEQASVDLVYPLGTDVKFTVKGKGEVHLLGMYDPVEDMNMGYDSSDEEGMMFGSEDSDLEGEAEEDSDEALRMQYGTGRGLKITELPEGSDDEEDSEDEGVAVPVQQPKKQQQGQKQGGQQQGQKQGGQQQGQKQGGQQGQKQGGQQQGQKQGGQQQGQKQGGQQGNNQQGGQKRKNPQDAPNQPQQKKQKTGQSPNNQQKRK
jgi:hypothetical protein